MVSNKKVDAFFLYELEHANYADLVRAKTLKYLFPNFKNLNDLENELKTVLNAYYNNDFFIRKNFSIFENFADDFFVLLNIKDHKPAIDVAKKLVCSDFDYEKFFGAIYDIYEEKLKHDYANRLAKPFKQDEVFVDKNGKRYYNVIDITNKDFFLNVHNINMGFANDCLSAKIILNPEKFIDVNTNFSNTISCTILSPQFLGYALNQPLYDVLYGFHCSSKDDYLSVGCNSDISVEWGVNNRNPIIESRTILYDTDSICQNVNWTYAESVLWRTSNGAKRKPDYILCIDDINDNSLKHAKYFNVPIYYVDSVSCLKQIINKLFKELEELTSISLHNALNYSNKLNSLKNNLHCLYYLINFSNKEVPSLINEIDNLYFKSLEILDKIIESHKCKDNDFPDWIRLSQLKNIIVNIRPANITRSYKKACELCDDY